ncbi:MAG: hypothetical protein WCJ09_24885 [Planctomycetota bacterium]
MARNDQRRQKKLEAKRTKRKEQSKAVARLKSTGVAERMLAGSRWPITESRISDTLWDQGMGYAVLVRRGPGGTAAMSMFLLDVFCLGVKDAIAHFGPEIDVSSRLSQMSDNGIRWLKVSPEYVRKLVEGSIGYALNLGLAPHRDCAAAIKLFGDIDASKCEDKFEFGCEGKPRFISGPHDSPARCQAVMDTLNRTCGVGNFHYVMHVNDPNDLFEDELEDDDEMYVDEDDE